MEAPSHLNFQLAQTFFGFKPEHRITMHENLFNMVWHGEGRWDWDTIYNMPVHIRRFWEKQVTTIIKSHIEQHESRKKKQTTSRTALPTAPNPMPTRSK